MISAAPDMFLGGLYPISSRFALDAVALIGLSYASATPAKSLFSTATLVLSCIMTITTAGNWSNRWPLTLPMAAVLLLQGLRRLIPTKAALSNRCFRWVGLGLTFFSLFLILMAAVLCVLFPAVQLPPIKGALYKVGVVDFYLPVNITSSEFHTACLSSNKEHSDNQFKGTTLLPVRLLYPSVDISQSVPKKATRIPLLNPATAVEFCRQTIRFGAPRQLRKFGWVLHSWRLPKLPVFFKAPILEKTPILVKSTSSEPEIDNEYQQQPDNAVTKWPLVVFSHGLSGTFEIYSYQTIALAAQGNIVLAVNHLDGSAPVVQLANGTKLFMDLDLSKLWANGKYVEYVRARRERTEHRAQEMLAATDALIQLNGNAMDSRNEEYVHNQLGFSLQNRLDTTNGVTFMGHSFGGATALTAGKRRPDLGHSIVAHDPALDWAPDDVRRSLFSEELLVGLEHHNFTGGTGGIQDMCTTNGATESSLHDMNILFLFSAEWRTKGWAWSPLLEEMYQTGKLGYRNSASSFQVIKGAHHSEFSDTCMLTPVWLARSTGLTGSRSPTHTAADIAQATKEFLQNVKQRIGIKSLVQAKTN